MTDHELHLKKQLIALELKLIETFIYESDPDTWTGAGEETRDMGEKRRNLRKLDKQNALATYGVLNAVREKNGRFMTKEQREEAKKPQAANAEETKKQNALMEERLKHLRMN